MKRLPLLIGMLAVLLISGAWGCRSPRPAESCRQTPQPSRKTPAAEAVAVNPPSLPESGVRNLPSHGLSVEGRSIPYRVYGYGARTLLLIGGLHGDEPAGSELLRYFSDYIPVHPRAMQGWQVVVVEAANPDGLADHRRTNARGVDLNRNYDTKNRSNRPRYGHEPLSEPEARFLVSLIDHFEPERILSIHQPVACVDWDGPAEDLARALSRASGLPLRKLGVQPGSLGSYAGVEKGIPIITLELPRQATDWDGETLWLRYGEAVLEFLRF